MLNLENNLIYFKIMMAFFIDLAAGDPHWFPHPVKGIGKIIQLGESALRYLRIPERLAGIVLAIFVVACVYLATQQFVKFMNGFGGMYETAASIVIIYLTISVRGLVKEAKKIITMLKSDDLHGARRELANIVGRDTANLDKDQIQRACIESLAENTVDGIISPLFFAFIGGAPLAMAYKAINTLDSMVGYKNDRYLKFGWASARLDDVANFLPARFMILLTPIASFLCAANPLNSLKIGLRDGHKHPSPNSGISEALFAGALRVQLGGSCSYNEINSDKPLIGDAEEELSVKKIEKAALMVYICAFLTIIFGTGVLMIVE